MWTTGFFSVIMILTMKNRKLLKTGGKPAPGELIIVQGFVNTLDVEKNVDDIGTTQLLKSWLVRHGLLRPEAGVSPADHRTVLALREALRTLMLVNNGQKLPPTAVNRINDLVSRFKLAVSLKTNGSISLLPGSLGLSGVCEQILARVIGAVNEGTWWRLKACDLDTCRWAFYDGSKNQSGRWCSMAVCGSREKARAYRRRQSDS